MVLRKDWVTPGVELVTLLDNLRCEHCLDDCLDALASEYNMPMGRLYDVEGKMCGLNNLCDRQTTIACKLLPAGFVVC